MKILGVILARAGSKRLPNKNTKLLNGKPLIEYTIDAAIESGVIDTLVVSTDDEKVKDIARFKKNYHLFNIITINRPDYLATDNASSEECILHAMDQVEKHDYVILLQPTSPLRTAEDIQTAYETMTSYGHAGIASYNSKTDKENGAFWIVEWNHLYYQRKLIRNYRYYMSEEKSIDIDTELDFKIAEMLLKEKE